MTTHNTVIMGMGKTGIACLRFLVKQGVAVRIMDNRNVPSYLAIVRQEFPQIPYCIGHFDPDWLATAQEIIISPGLSLDEPALSEAKAKYIPIISEIELFTRYVNAPIVAITGSNGKSTVTTLVGDMAKQAGWRVAVGGNLGTPALDLLHSPAPDLYVLELSSFQLETTYSLKPKTAVVLNISEDHMDRYATLDEYMAAKRRIYDNADIVVINADDANVVSMLQSHHKHLSFSLHPHRGNFTITTAKSGTPC
ncbi:MAG: UDP-N-acetylmuramoyl-L-alanine--D-glutamate ligase [Thiotrichaceae bacterium]